MNVYQRFGVPTVINAAGTVTRLSGGHMHAHVLAAMRDAAGACVDMPTLQAGASRVIARVTGAEAGIVTSGASAALLLGAAACLAGLDSARMNRLPDVADRYSGPGVRDAAPWEIEAAITPRTAAICYLAQPQSRPALAEVTTVAHAHALPVLVDAAAQLPPKDNLRRFLADGADLVAFSGGKAIGGPQASGILAGRADLIASALMQLVDLDLYPDTWNPPDEFARLRQLRGLPQHGIGRSCKVGKEEIIGLLVALERFAATDDAARHTAWHDILRAIVAAADGTSVQLAIVDRAVPLLELRTPDATVLAARLAAHDPPILCSVGRREENVLVISPAALTMDQATIIGAALRAI